MTARILHLLILALIVSLPVSGSAAEKLEWRDGDRVVLLGSGLIEREGKYGHLEAAMTAQWPGKSITYRNLGWSGDTVFGTARSYFGPPNEGFERLRNHVKFLKPTVVVAAYGSVESFEGQAGLEQFTVGYKRLIKMLKEDSGGARVVLMTPPPFESKGAPLPDMTERNKDLGLYRDRIREIAAAEECFFADAFASVGDAQGLTSDGVHFTPDGYASIAEKVLASFGWQARTLRTDQLEAMRKAIVAKNQLFFYRWRPQNETYLHGFRKHEQGNNAKEVPQFDPLVESKDEEIAKLRAALGN